MRVLLLQVDGKIPNLALMRLAYHHRERGDTVALRHAPTVASVERGLFEEWDRVYASAIFEWSRPVCRRLLEVFPDAIIGGTGWDESKTVEKLGVTTRQQDYTDYPKFRHSLGFTQRGCRLKCSFCKVPQTEGKVRVNASVWDIWRGEPWPRELILLDNDFFGAPNWRSTIADIISGGFKVCFNQGFNVRLIGEEEAAAIASVPYYDDQFKTRRLYTAWDNRRDEDRLFRNLDALVRHGVRPDSIMVYMLVAYDHETKVQRPFLTEDDFYRHARLRDFGCRPYPMPYVRNDETRGFQRWIVGAYDKRIPWEVWERAGYEPRNLGFQEAGLFDESI